VKWLLGTRSQSKAQRQCSMMGVVLLAFALRVYRLDYQSLWRDEADALRFALLPLRELLGTFVQRGWNGPLYFSLLRLWVSTAGRTEFALRFPSLLGGVLAASLTYALGRRVGFYRLAILGSLLVATSPYLVWYSQEAKMYALLTAGVLLSWHLYLRALDQGGRGAWVGYVLVTSLCIYVHLLAVLLIPTQATAFLLQRKRYRQQMRSWLSAMAALTLPYLPLARWQIPLFFSDFETGHPFYTLSQILSILLHSFSLGISPQPTLQLLFPYLQRWTGLFPHEGLIVTLFLSLTALLLYRDRESLQVMLCWLLLPPVIVYLISLGMPMFNARYLIWIAPALLLLSGMGLIVVRQQSRLLFILCLIALLIVDAGALWVQSHSPIKSDFRSAAAYVRDRRQPTEPILFLIPYIRHTFEYYYGPADPWAGGPYTNAGMSLEEVGQYLREATDGAQSLWLVMSEPGMWDERGLLWQWLESSGHRTDDTLLARVRVTRYVLRD